MLQRGVLLDETLVLLVVALTLQPVLEWVDAASREAPLVPYGVDMNNCGKVMPASGLFRHLCMDDAGVRSIRVDSQAPK